MCGDNIPLFLFLFLLFNLIRYMHMASGYTAIPLVLCLQMVSVYRLGKHTKANKGMKQHRARPSSFSFRGWILIISYFITYSFSLFLP